MNAIHSKRAFLYRQVRRALRSGRYVPGQRIDPTTLAAEFRTSLTPVRFALYRLVGNGMIADHARGGLYVPLPTEVAMRDLYDWMRRLLHMACDLGVASPTHKTTNEPALASGDDDLAKLTWRLFDSIAGATGQQALHRALKRTNDQLAPIRHAKQGLLEDASDEFLALNRHWREGDLPALKSALHDYHERRKRLAPQIVALLRDGNDYLH